MNDYILFIDIKTSDMPKRWNAPTTKVEEWPYILQIAWVVCRKSGEEVTRKDFYMKHEDIPIEDIASRLQGVTPENLKEKGEERRIVLYTLSADLQLYKPLIVAHFLEFDKRMLEVGFSREEIVRNFDDLPKFCTMLQTRKRADLLGSATYLRLSELYETLLGKPMSNPHNAAAEAEATKDCFFALVARGKITDQVIAKQKRGKSRKWELPLSVVITIAAVVGSSLFLVLHFLM